MAGTPSMKYFFGSPWTPVVASLVPGRTEAEDLTIAQGFEVATNPHPSGGAYLQANDIQSYAAGVFEGASRLSSSSGLYDVVIGYFDETDGVGIMSLRVNGVEIGEFDWDSMAGDDIVTKASKMEHVFEGVHIADGDVVEIAGAGDGGEPLRTDYIDLIPVMEPGDTWRIEAEDMAIAQGFKVVSNGAASGGKTLQHDAGLSHVAIAAYTVDRSGYYDLTVGYFDETDGVSHMTVRAGNEYVLDLTFDSEDGDRIASRQSAMTATATSVWLERGETIQIQGEGQGGEPLRVDYIELTATEDPEPQAPASLDMWYYRDGEVVVALNDGTGGFTEKVADLEGRSGVLFSVDYDGDGNLDFVDVTPSLPEPLGANWVDEPTYFDVSLSVTYYHNDGAGSFSRSHTVSDTYVIVLDPYSYIEFDDATFDFIQPIDAADVDGDGDVDILATSYGAQSLLYFQSYQNIGFELEPESKVQLGYNGNQGQAADMNGDGLLDVLISAGNEVSGTIVMINQGDSTFSYAGIIAPSDDGTTNEQVFDADGDGDMDILVRAISDGGGVYLYLNDGTGMMEAGFYPDYPPAYEETIGGLLIGNFDSDAEAEIIMPGFEAPYDGFEPGLRVLSLSDDRSTLELDSFDPSIKGHAVATGDFDGDGDLDFLLSPRNGGYYYDPDETLPTQLYLIANDGEANFTNEGPVTPEFLRDYGFYGWPSAHVGYFDDFAVVA